MSTEATAIRRRQLRVPGALSFRNIGAIYVWLAIIAVFSVWIPDIFPNWDTAKQILNGYAVTGRAILDYNSTYPQTYDAETTRHVVSGQATYQVQRALSVSAGVRFEREDGTTESDQVRTSTRNNPGAFVEVQAAQGPVSVTAGVGFLRRISHHTPARSMIPIHNRSKKP